MLREIRGPAPAGDLERRVAALERAVAGLGRGGKRPGVVSVRSASATVAHQLLDVGGGAGECVLEPGKPCCSSGRCRSFGH